jgi:plasmid stability protein
MVYEHHRKTGKANLRVQEVFEEPSAEHGHRAFRKAPLWSPDVVRLPESSHRACSLKRAAAACESEHRDVLTQALLGSSTLHRVAQLALYHALEALEMLRHGPQRQGRERGGVAEPGDGLERSHHSLDLLVVLPVPLADLGKAS